MFIAIISVSNTNRIEKFQEFDTLEEAQAHVLVHGGFAAEEPVEGDLTDWFADPIEETLIYSPPEPTNDQVNAERDRRIDDGIIYDFTAATGGLIGEVEFQTDLPSRENIAGAATFAFMAMSQGANTTNLRWASAEEDFTWIAADNSQIPMSAPLCLDFCTKAMSYKSALIKAARILKDADPTPQDYASNNAHWPSKVINT